MSKRIFKTPIITRGGIPCKMLSSSSIFLSIITSTCPHCFSPFFFFAFPGPKEMPNSFEASKFFVVHVCPAPDDHDNTVWRTILLM